jgi:ATP-dependent Lhr-like helicase
MRRGSRSSDRHNGTRLLRTQVEDALAELVVVGLVHSDSFSGLRALLIPSDRQVGSALLAYLG